MRAANGLYPPNYYGLCAWSEILRQVGFLISMGADFQLIFTAFLINKPTLSS